MPWSEPPSAASPSPNCRPSRKLGFRSAAPISLRILQRWPYFWPHPGRATSPGKPTMSTVDWCRAESQLAFARSPGDDRSPPGAAKSAERAPAFLLWLGRPRLPVLCRLCAARPGGRHLVDLCRAVDSRIRLVAHRTVGGCFARRRAGSSVIAADRPAARSSWRASHSLHRGAGDRDRVDASVADPIAAGLLSAVLHCSDELGRAVRFGHLRRRQ